MSDNSLQQLRRANLRIITEGMPQKFTGSIFGRSQAHMSHIMSGRRNITTNLARLIEQMFDKPQLWLDRHHPEECPYCQLALTGVNSSSIG